MTRARHAGGCALHGNLSAQISGRCRGARLLLPRCWHVHRARSTRPCTLHPRPYPRPYPQNSLLYPALIEGPIVVTNAKGVFSSSLAEWALFAMSWRAASASISRDCAPAGGLWVPRRISSTHAPGCFMNL